MNRSILAIIFSCALVGVYAQTIQSNGTGGGAWNNAATWAGGVSPDFANSTKIRILAGDVVTIPSGFSVSIDQTVIHAGGTVIVQPGGVLSVVNGAGSDLSIGLTGSLAVDGRLEFGTGVTTYQVTSGNTTIRSGGVYRHRSSTGGAVVSALWEDGSTLEFTDFTSSYGNPSNLGQSFFNVVWDCPGQTVYKTVLGFSTIRGDFIVRSTGSSHIRLFDSYSGRTLNIGGNVEIEGSSSVHFSRSGTNNTLNISGDFLYNSSGYSQFTQTGSLTINLDGDFQHTAGGNLRLGSSGALIDLNLRGDMILNGPVTSLFDATTNVTFEGSSIQNFERTSSLTGIINYEVPGGSGLDLGVSSMVGGGSFALRSGATLYLAASNGIGTNAFGALQANTTEGQIRVPVSRRTYEPGSLIVYNGTTDQAIGNGQPSGVNVVIDNPSTVTMVANFAAAQVTLEQGTLGNDIYNITLSGDWVVNNGTLNPGTGQLIFNGVSTLSGPGPKNFGNVIVQDGAQLTLPDETITVTGNITIGSSAAVVTNQGTVVLVGAGAQVISANSTVFNNISVNKSAGDVSLSTGLLLRGLLDIQSATTFNSNGFLTLLSSGDRPAVDAAIGALPAGAAVVGNVTVQRYMGAVGTVWRFISSPVQETPLADLKDDFRIAGNSFRWYDPELVNKPRNERFRTVPANSTTYRLVVGRGYTPFMWVDAVVNLDFTGPINAGPISMPVAFGQSTPAMPDADGWNLLGNPYPSAISWDGGPGWNLSNMAPTVGIEESGTTGVWHYFNYRDNSGDIPNGYIAMGQGFWVFANAPNPVVEINEQAKTNAKGGSFYREKAPEISKQLIVVLSGNDGTRKAFLKLNSAATPEFDADLDAYPLPLPAMEDMNIELVDRNGTRLLMHTLPEIVDEEIPVNVIVPGAGEYSISFVNDGQFPIGGGLYLHDRFQGTSTAVNSNTPYGFSATQAGAISDRFYLSTSPGMERRLDDMVSVYPNPFTSQLVIEVASSESVVSEILDVTGKQVSTQEFSGRTEVETANLTSGVYFAKIRTTQGVVIRRILKR